MERRPRTSSAGCRTLERPLDWVEAGGTDKIGYGFHISEGTTGYVAMTSMWHILTGTLRTTSLFGHIIDEQTVTTISPKVLSNGEIDGEVQFMKLESHQLTPSP